MTDDTRQAGRHSAQEPEGDGPGHCSGARSRQCGRIDSEAARAPSGEYDTVAIGRRGDTLRQNYTIEHMIEGAASAPSPRTVLYLTTSLETLGPATALVELALRLDPRRYTPVVVQLDQSRNGRLETRLTQAGVALHSIGVSSVAAVAHVSGLARRLRASVV